MIRNGKALDIPLVTRRRAMDPWPSPSSLPVANNSEMIVFSFYSRIDAVRDKVTRIIDVSIYGLALIKSMHITPKAL